LGVRPPLFEKVEILGWFIHRFHHKKRFTEEDIRRCLDHLDIQVGADQPIISEDGNINKHYDGYRVNFHTLGKLDARYELLLAQTEVHNLLKELPAKLSLTDEQSYLEETIICYAFGAYRAAIVMCWNLVYSHLCNFILADPTRLAAFNKTISAKDATPTGDPQNWRLLALNRASDYPPQPGALLPLPGDETARLIFY
jgi:hypothetical protein